MHSLFYGKWLTYINTVAFSRIGYGKSFHPQSAHHYLLRMNKDASFLNRALLRNFLDQIEGGGRLVIDGSKTHDIMETIEDFIQSASDADIVVETIELGEKEKLKVNQKLVYQSN